MRLLISEGFGGKDSGGGGGGIERGQKRDSYGDYGDYDCVDGAGGEG